MENEIGRLIIALEGQVQGLVSKVDEVEKTIGGFTTKSESHFKKVEDQWLKTAGAFLVGQLGIGSIQQAFGTLTNIIKESIAEFDKDIVVLEQLRAHLGDGAAALNSYAEQQSKVTRYAHDEYLESSKMLAVHKLNEEEIRKILPVIADYAAATGRDLTSTTQAFSYALQYGTTRGLRAYGIELDKSGSQQEIFNTLVGLGEGNVKGLAEKMAGIGAGPMVVVSNKLGEIQKELGEKLTPQVREFADVISNTLIPAFENLLPLIGMWSTGFSDLFRQWATGVEPTLTAIGKFAKGVMDMAHDVSLAMRLIGASATFNFSEANKLAAELFGIKPEATPPPVLPSTAGEGTWKRGGNYVRGATPMEQFLAEHPEGKPGIPSRLGTTPLGDKGTGAGDVISSALAIEVEKIGLAMDKLNAIYKEGQLGPVKYYHETVALINEKYTAEEDALNKSLKLAKTDDDKTKVRNSLKLLEVKKDRELLAQKQKLNDEEIKAEQEVSKRRDELAETRLKALQAMSDTITDIGRVLGEGLVTGFSSTAEGLKGVFKKVLETLLSFLEKYALLAAKKAWFEEIMTKGWFGIATAAVITGLIIGAFESVKAIVLRSMETGGPVAGPRHAQGGVNVNMEGGEFVHPRSAVAYYGGNVMEGLRRMVIPRDVFGGIPGMAVATAGASAAAGGVVRGGSGSPLIVNFIDPTLFDRYVASRVGQRAIINVIKKNQFDINRG